MQLGVFSQPATSEFGNGSDLPCRAGNIGNFQFKFRILRKSQETNQPGQLRTDGYSPENVTRSLKAGSEIGSRSPNDVTYAAAQRYRVQKALSTTAAEPIRIHCVHRIITCVGIGLPR